VGEEEKKKKKGGGRGVRGMKCVLFSVEWPELGGKKKKVFRRGAEFREEEEKG